MEILEFLQRTNHRNLQYNISYMVKQKMKEAVEELQFKREKLRCILQSEALQYDEEILLLINEQIKKKAQQRLQWLGIKRIERERAEEELLKLKNEQRLIENCEEMRHLQSKQILMETKQAQLYQIEEKKILRQKERYIENMWLEAMQRLNEEKEKQESYERKLHKVIADSDQAKNMKQNEALMLEMKATAEALKQESIEDNERTLKIEQKYRTDEQIYERRKKLYYHDVLEDQIRHNRINDEMQKGLQLEEDNYNKQREDQQIINELQEKHKQMIQNREWQKKFINYKDQEQKMMHERDKEYNEMLLGTSTCCLLQLQQPQKKNKPYCKEVR